MWPPVQTLQISLQCVWLTLALLSLIPSSPILHHLSPQYIVNFIHFYLIGILNCLKLCIHLHFHRAPFLLSSLSISIFRDNTIKSFQPFLPVFYFFLPFSSTPLQKGALGTFPHFPLCILTKYFASYVSSRNSSYSIFSHPIMPSVLHCCSLLISPTLCSTLGILSSTFYFHFPSPLQGQSNSYILQSVHLHILSHHVPSYPLSSHIEDSQAYSVNKRCLSISLNSSHVSFLLRQFVLLDSFLYQIATYPYPPDPSNLLLPYGDDHQPIINIISISARSICIMCFFLPSSCDASGILSV